MPDSTKRLLTDETGQDIVDALSALTNVVDPNGTTVAAALKLNNMTTSVTVLPAGSTPTSSLTEVDGHFHLTLGIPLQIPVVTATNNGEILKVENGAWTVGQAPTGVPAVTSSDNGKILQVSNGAWAAEDNISIGRKANTTIGTHSVAVGNDVEASADNAYAEGSGTRAAYVDSHAEGWGSEAISQAAHAEGRQGRATAFAAHAEGCQTTASGYASHSQGMGTQAKNKSQHVAGEYNVLDPSVNAAGNRGDYAEIIGNGTDANNRSNARTLDWNGNERLMGDIYVGCNADSTGGTKVIKATDIMTGATLSDDGANGLVPAPTAADVDKFLSGDGTYKSGGLPMVILSYGKSTWQEFINAYKNNVIVYCRASSNANPAAGSQTRLGFMAYVSDATNPSNVEFQYYRSMNPNNKTINQMSDQVYVYKLTSNGTWSVEVREASLKSVVFDASSGLTGTFDKSTGTLTIAAAT